MHERATPLISPVRSPIAQLLHDLRALGDLRRRAATVDERLDGWRAPLDRLLGCLPLPRRGYARTLVYRCDGFELLLLTWAAGSPSPIHDHAAQDCWFVPIAGLFELDDYTIGDDDGAVTELVPWRRRRVHAGALDHRDEREAVHAVTPLTPVAVSLHVYARPIDSCRVFDRRGAWSWRRLRYDAFAPQLGG
jgi:cysteine dioxygenase